MEDTRERVRALLKELDITQVEVISYMNGSPTVPYRVTPAEFSNALRGALVSPKANRIMTDALSYLDRRGKSRAARGRK